MTSEEKNITNESTSEVTAPESASTEAAGSVDPNAFVPELLTVTPSPHIRAYDTTRTIMLDVCIALLPALIWGIYIFGLRALSVVLISVIFAVLSEFVWEKLMKKPVTVLDFSAVVTGMLIGMNLPVSVPLWIPAVGSIFAIIVVKQLFGGLGKNFVNPALAARVFLFAWPAHMNTFVSPETSLSPLAVSVPDVVASATPLSALKNGIMPTSTTLFNSVLGFESGCIGEVSALLLTAGFVYLLVRRVITWHIPVAFIGTVFVLAYIFPQSAPTLDFALYEIFSGGLFLGAIFMATDYVTSPITTKGRIIYGIGCGALTVFIRYFGGYPEGVSFAILIMNLLVWYLDRYTKPKRFGGAKVGKAKN
ncbi:MAG: RnfABCDGE type electron transport complex subunit D [Clostridia bacterium]|nr:RnfABCDGE type electron transport complex subunit D [Clostridia bacterium]